MTRRIAFEGIDNFRDFGDYAAGQKRLKRGLLYRAAHQSRATDADLAALRDLGISLIVDLRRPNEREREPSRRWDGFAAEVVESNIGQATLDEWQSFIATSDLSEQSFRDYMLEYYRLAPHEPRHIDLYRRYFRGLAQTEGAVLVHCAAGKDRTGIICALTHHIAGVHEDDIVEDYLLTNDHERLTARAPVMIEMIREQHGKAPSEAAALVAMSVEAAYLERAFEVMREQHGSLDGYLDQVLGLDADLRGRIHDRILA
ncbi:MAG: tyrosine-protein phosphatase [Phenylobacterium sp.]